MGAMSTTIHPTQTNPWSQSSQGYYYVTAVNYQGERRYGRKYMDGKLSWRDPGQLPACDE